MVTAMTKQFPHMVTLGEPDLARAVSMQTSMKEIEGTNTKGGG